MKGILYSSFVYSSYTLLTILREEKANMFTLASRFFLNPRAWEFHGLHRKRLKYVLVTLVPLGGNTTTLGAAKHMYICVPERIDRRYM